MYPLPGSAASASSPLLPLALCGVFFVPVDLEAIPLRSTPTLPSVKLTSSSRPLVCNRRRRSPLCLHSGWVSTVDIESVISMNANRARLFDDFAADVGVADDNRIEHIFFGFQRRRDEFSNLSGRSRSMPLDNHFSIFWHQKPQIG